MSVKWGFKDLVEEFVPPRGLRKKFSFGLAFAPPPMVRVKAGQTGDHCLGVTSQFGGASNPPPPFPHRYRILTMVNNR